MQKAHEDDYCHHSTGNSQCYTDSDTGKIFHSTTGSTHTQLNQRKNRFDAHPDKIRNLEIPNITSTYIAANSQRRRCCQLMAILEYCSEIFTHPKQKAGWGVYTSFWQAHLHATIDLHMPLPYDVISAPTEIAVAGPCYTRTQNENVKKRGRSRNFT